MEEMKYWGLFLGKLILVAAVLYAVWLGMSAWFPEPAPTLYYSDPFVRDLPYTLRVFVFWLFSAGLLYLMVWDQRYRCRTCLRRLRMPVATGSWTNMVLFGPPRTEYICPYGHGTLRVPEVQITGAEPPDWQPHGDMWRELYGLEETKKK